MGDGIRCVDGAGILPDILSPVFTDDELDHHRDSALRRARTLLASLEAAAPR